MSTFAKTDGTVTVKGPSGRIITNLPGEATAGPTPTIAVDFATVRAASRAVAHDRSIPWQDRAAAFGLDVDAAVAAIQSNRVHYQTDRYYSAANIDTASEALQTWDLDSFNNAVTDHAIEDYYTNSTFEEEIYEAAGAHTEEERAIIEDAIVLEAINRGDFEVEDGWFSCGAATRFGILGEDGISRTSTGSIFLDTGIEVLEERTGADGLVRPENASEFNALSALASDGGTFELPLDEWGRPRMVVSDEVRAEIVERMSGCTYTIWDDMREQITAERIVDDSGVPYTAETFFRKS